MVGGGDDEDLAEVVIAAVFQGQFNLSTWKPDPIADPLPLTPLPRGKFMIKCRQRLDGLVHGSAAFF